ncbi:MULTISPECIES: hypothetical protein [Paenibacillus]|uniref:hypothetical protein n=1 Tax=Paenibacillus TaxID=44249 RepID=UPI0011A7EEF3|nr:hypothetical protein [Paenibacillus sp. IHBB 10380]
MWQRDLKSAIKKKQLVTIRLKDGDVIHGIPEQFNDHVKLRRDYEVTWVPTAKIEHVNRLIQFQPKKDPASE